MRNYYNYFQNYGVRDLNFFVATSGLANGNMSEGLYNKFRDYVPEPLSSTNDDALEIMAYQFALLDLGLYLDTNPNDQTVKNLYDTYLNKYRSAASVFQQQFGPLTLDSDAIFENGWDWLNSWPWEGLV